MRFSTSYLLAALPAVVVAAVIPSPSDPFHRDSRRSITDVPKDGSTFVFVDPSHDQPNVVFSVPCIGCAHDDALLFNFRAFSTKEACGVANVTINGQSIDQVWNGTHGLGTGEIRSLPYSSQYRLFAHRLDLSVESSCLSNSASSPSESLTPGSHSSSAQVFTVTIRSVDGEQLTALSGFTISYRPQIPLELLRLSARPDLSATRQPISSLWHDPPQEFRLPHHRQADLEGESVTPPSLDDFEQDLERIFAETNQKDELSKEAYKAAIEEDMKGIQGLDLSPANQEFMRLADELEHLENFLIESTASLVDQHSKDKIINAPGTVAPECRNVRCLVHNFFHDARDALERFFLRIKPNFASAQTSASSHQVSLDAMPPYRDDLKPTPTPLSTAWSSSPTPFASVYSNPDYASPHTYFAGSSSRFSDPIEPLTLTLKIIGALTGLTCILVLARRSTCTCPQARADRRARAEQRRTERLYRRAARSFQVQKWWTRWTGWRRDGQRTHDYEEKRALIRQQEGLLEGVMQDEIRLLRAAHDAVNSIISASDRGAGVNSGPIPIMAPYRGQHQYQYQPYRQPQQQQNHTPDIEAWQNVPLSRTDSLPDYRSDAGSSHFSSEPPAYSDDEGDLVTDGFRGYRGGDVSDDSDVEPLPPVPRDGEHPRRWSPGSSVISTSPRPSQETMRFLVR